MIIIRISEELSMESFKLFSKKLAKIEDSEDRIIIELASPGGDSYAALAYSARMRRSPLLIIVEAYGEVASAAVLVLASGDKRKMTSEAWVMVHENAGPLEGTVVQLEKETHQLRRLEQQWAELLAERTNTLAEVWTALHKDTTYLNAEQCLKLGLIDEVI